MNQDIEKIIEKTNLDNTSIIRALTFLEKKGLIKLKKTTEKIVDLGTNGIYYKKTHLPERKLTLLLENNNIIELEEAKKLSKLSDNEFKISLKASKEELIKKTLEEQLLEILPIEQSQLAPEQLHALENLKKRKNIIEIKERSSLEVELTDLGKQLTGKNIELDLIEEITPEIIKTWNKNKKFRSYDVQSKVPKIYGGKKHFVNESIEYAKRIWMDLGFKEMSSTLTETSFWNFDSLFTPQDHPAREMQDTFFIKETEGKLPDKEDRK